MADLDPPMSKFAAYRARKKAAGLKEVRRWVWDVNSSEFQAALDRDIATIKASQSESDVLDFIEGVMADTMNEHPY